MADCKWNVKAILAILLLMPPRSSDRLRAAPEGGIPKSARFVAVWNLVQNREHGKPSVVLPDISFAERQGSYTNVEGTVQFLRPPIPVQPPLKEGWEVLCELGAALGVRLDYPGIFPIQRELASKVPALASLAQPPSPDPAPPPVLVGPAHP